MQLLWLTNLFCFLGLFWAERTAVGYLFIWLFVRSFSSAKSQNLADCRNYVFLELWNLL